MASGSAAPRFGVVFCSLAASFGPRVLRVPVLAFSGNVNFAGLSADPVLEVGAFMCRRSSLFCTGLRE